MSTTPIATKAGRREWIGLAVIALPCLLYSMDLTVLNLAVPHLSADLRPSNSQLLWIVDIYGFLIAGSLITMGTLGDRIGRRRLLADRRGRLRCRLDPRCILHQRGDAHCGARPAGGRQRNARPLHAFPDSQHVPRSGAAHGRHRRLDRQLFRRWRRWTAAGRASARTLLVGFGLPGERPRDAAPARARTGAAAGVPRSGRGAARPHQRGALARRRAGDDLRHQADRRGWPGLALRAGHPGGPRRRRAVRSAAEQARRPADRSRALPFRSLQRRAGGQSAGILRGIRNLSLHRPISAARSGDGPARSRSVDRAIGGRFHRRLATGPDDRAPNASGLRDGRRLSGGRRWLRGAGTGRRTSRTGCPGDRLRPVVVGPGTGVHPGDRSDRRDRPGRARRRRGRHCRDQLRVGWRTRHRPTRQRRHGRLPQRRDERGPERATRRGDRSGPRQPRRRAGSGGAAVRPDRRGTRRRGSRSVRPGLRADCDHLRRRGAGRGRRGGSDAATGGNAPRPKRTRAGMSRPRVAAPSTLPRAAPQQRPKCAEGATRDGYRGAVMEAAGTAPQR